MIVEDDKQAVVNRALEVLLGQVQANLLQARANDATSRGLLGVVADLVHMKVKTNMEVRPKIKSK